MNNHARGLFCTLVSLFATSYQQESFRTLMALFLRGDGHPHPSRATSKSESALSRFLNRYAWSARALTRHTRAAAITSLLSYYEHQRGRRPRLLVLLDLTSLEKAGRFEQLGLVSVLNKKQGLHLVVMYLQAGPLRFPWALRVWRGKGEASASELALSLLHSLPQVLLQLNPLVLADAGFGTTSFLVGVKRLGMDAVVGMRCDRRLADGRGISQARSGERVILLGLPFPVTVARYHLPRNKAWETRFVVATFVAAARVISRWGRRRWRIEAFFKTAKSRFGLGRFGQGTRRGVYRFLLLSLLAFTLAQWQLWQFQGEWPDWGEAATTLRRELLPDLILAELMTELERLRPYLKAAELSLQT